MIRIEKIDNVFIKVHSDESTAKELSSFFTFKIPNHQYVPAFRKRRWDGRLRLFNYASRTIYGGLLDHVEKFLNDRSYPYEKVNFESVIFAEDYVDEWLNKQEIYSNGKKITPYDYQLNAVKEAILKNRILLLSPTGSGKSLIIYLILKFLSENSENTKFLIIVPSTGLVNQMTSDFLDYSNNDIVFSRNIHKIFSGQEKDTNKQFVITTWQSVFRLPEQFFHKFQGVIGDEAHGAKSKSLISLMKKLKNCPFKIGTTGTLDGVHCHKLIIEGLFGRCFTVTSTKTLIDENILSNLDIQCLLLNYDESEKQTIKKANYHDEIQWLIQHPKRNKFICDLAENLSGNVLILFNYVDNQGIPLYEYLNKRKKKDIHYISGMTDVDEREIIRKVVDKNDNSILVASFGTCSQGINIKNINHVIFASPSKSIIRIQQSIGRGLRKSETKDSVVVYDLGDDLRYKSFRNYALKHMDERIDLYTKEKFPFKVTKIRL